MMGEVLDAFILQLAGRPADQLVALGVAEGGLELRAGLRVDRVGVEECLSVHVEVPEPPTGRVFVVLCRWSDEEGALAYCAPRDGAPALRWRRLELVPGGVRLSVRWPGEGEVRVYEFRWLGLRRPAPDAGGPSTNPPNVFPNPASSSR